MQNNNRTTPLSPSSKIWFSERYVQLAVEIVKVFLSKWLIVFIDRVMENEEGRKEYLVFPTNKNHCPNQKGRKIPLKGNGRRIDYILYSEAVQQDWKVVRSLPNMETLAKYPQDSKEVEM